jgi:hypothetical protein
MPGIHPGRADWKGTRASRAESTPGTWTPPHSSPSASRNVALHLTSETDQAVGATIRRGLIPCQDPAPPVRGHRSCRRIERVINDARTACHRPPGRPPGRSARRDRRIPTGPRRARHGEITECRSPGCCRRGTPLARQPLWLAGVVTWGPSLRGGCPAWQRRQASPPPDSPTVTHVGCREFLHRDLSRDPHVDMAWRAHVPPDRLFAGAGRLATWLLHGKAAAGRARRPRTCFVPGPSNGCGSWI